MNGSASSVFVLQDSSKELPHERPLCNVIWNENPGTIKGYNPGTYQVRNTGTGKIKTYYALAPDRALALAYLDQGVDHPMELVGSS